jgi:hypothetical protein
MNKMLTVFILCIGLFIALGSLAAEPDLNTTDTSITQQKDAPKVLDSDKQSSGGTVHCDICTTYCTRTICDLSKCYDEKYACGTHSCNCRPGS